MAVSLGGIETVCIAGLARCGELWEQPVSGAYMMTWLCRLYRAVEHHAVERGRVAVHIEKGACNPVDQRGDADRSKAGKKAVDSEVLEPAQGLDRLRGHGKHAGGIAAAGMRARGDDGGLNGCRLVDVEGNIAGVFKQRVSHHDGRQGCVTETELLGCR